MRFRCKVCHKRVTIKPIYSRDNREILLRCPNSKCNSEGIFKNKNYVPFLFVKNIKLVSRQYLSVLNSSQLRLGDARSFGSKPPILDSKKFFSEHRHNLK